ncbi:MAG: hypothetical protein JSU90_05115 [Nitrospiraceae bacterium]|nr:MAG: hypothetical protein JSU90_05115 [Nitrospiraceae bacterium]
MLPKENSKDTPWIISEGCPVRLDLSNVCQGSLSEMVTEYRISDLTRYMLNPNPTTLEEKVVGCKVFYRRPSRGPFRRFLKKMTGTGRPSNGEDRDFIEEIVSPAKTGVPVFRDSGLNDHFNRIRELLRPYDPVQKRLSSLDREKIEDIKALCEDIGRNRYQLNLQGAIQDKINFVSRSLSTKTKVVANRAYLLNGLFEMRGLNFKTYNGRNSYRLIKFIQDGQVRYCVLSGSYQVEYWVTDVVLINYMHILEQCIRSDQRLREALTNCMNGQALPLKLFFARQIGQEYSLKHLPLMYRQLLSGRTVGQDEWEAIAEALNRFQSVISFNYVPLYGSGRHRLCTNISVMHDLRALTPLKGQIPEVYSEINKKASVSEAGTLYLLDSMMGYQNV